MTAMLMIWGHPHFCVFNHLGLMTPGPHQIRARLSLIAVILRIKKKTEAGEPISSQSAASSPDLGGRP